MLLAHILIYQKCFDFWRKQSNICSSLYYRLGKTRTRNQHLFTSGKDQQAWRKDNQPRQRSVVVNLSKQLRRSHCGGWVPKTSCSYHYWQPAPRWRPHLWLAKPENPAMSPHALDKTGTRHTELHSGKQRVGKGGNKTAKCSTHNAPNSTLIKRHYSPEHEEFHACTSILNLQTNWLQMLLLLYLVKLHLTSCNERHTR